jgi:hypothetical protein
MNDSGARKSLVTIAVISALALFPLATAVDDPEDQASSRSAMRAQ